MLSTQKLTNIFGDLSYRPTQSIGMLSYTFLRNTAKEDIVVPMVSHLTHLFHRLFCAVMMYVFIPIV